MIRVNRAPLVEGLETVFSHILVTNDPKEIGRGECVAIAAQNPLLNPDGTANNAAIFVGSASNMIYFMLPGQESPIIYAEDLKDIYMRVNFPAVNPNGEILTASTGGAGAPGTGYTAGNVLTLVPPSGGGSVATITIDTVDGSGVITGFTVTNGGTGFVVNDAVSALGGSGVGAIFLVTSVDNSLQESADIALFIYRERKGGKQ